MDSSRITLRPFKLTDVDDMMLWVGDDRVTRTIRWKTLTSKEEVLTFIKEVCIPHPWRRSICIDDRSIGFVSAFPGSDDDRSRADIGYAIGFEYWGQGIATKAIKMTIPQAFNDFPHVIRLQALADVENKASQRVLEKVGFIKEGILRKYGYHKGKIVDLVMYSLLSTEYNDTTPSGQ
ncbi:putative la-related protein 1-like [Capsicum annuum]|nr:putative la-related protein 1-like [Capsicum annuum]